MKEKFMRTWRWGLSLCLLAFVTCGPAEVPTIEEIGPNETAFLVPLEGDTQGGQKSFGSVEYLEKNKVAAKRVTHSMRKRSLGRMWFHYEWIPVTKVIKVNRAPVTREWQKKANSALEVESKDSVGFWTGITITASIAEKDAATFLYNFAGAQLDYVIDNNVRGLILSVLSREFGNRTLAECKLQKSDVISIALQEARDVFTSKGITIEYLGSSMGLNYSNPDIQTAIDATVVAETRKVTEQNTLEAEKKKAETLVVQARAQREAAEEFAKALEAQKASRGLEIDMLKAQADFKRAEATLEASKKWNGALPANILPSGSDMLFGLESVKK
jgi:hypothetical protein